MARYQQGLSSLIFAKAGVIDMQAMPTNAAAPTGRVGKEQDVMVYGESDSEPAEEDSPLLNKETPDEEITQSQASVAPIAESTLLGSDLVRNYVALGQR